MPHETIAAPDIDIPPELRDGYEVLRAALARGLNVTLLPRQVMIVETPGPNPTQHSFIHGIPESSSLAGVTYAQDRRMRRALLARNGFTVPKGATFSIGRSVGAARRYAQRLGYPVVAKPALGDNTIEVFSPINDEKELNRAIAHFRQPPDTRPGHTRAAYALTELREPGIKNGQLTAPLGYRFLIEEYVKGNYVRLLVLNGEVRNALLCPSGPWTTHHSEITDVTGAIHSDLKALATDATRALANLPVAAVDFVLDDYTAPAQTGQVTLVEFSERPWLAVQSSLDNSLSASIGNELLTIGLNEKLVLDPRHDAVSLHVTLDGCVEPDNLLDILCTNSTLSDFQTDFSVSDPAIGRLSGTIYGDTARVAGLMEALIGGKVTPNHPMLIELQHLS